MGRITAYDLGSAIFRGQEFLQFRNVKRKGLKPYKYEYVPLHETHYSGDRFRNFYNNPSLGAMAEICRVKENNNREVVLSILIPKKYKNKIKY